jgi:hypothetical protein
VLKTCQPHSLSIHSKHYKTPQDSTVIERHFSLSETWKKGGQGRSHGQTPLVKQGSASSWRCHSRERWTGSGGDGGGGGDAPG